MIRKYLLVALMVVVGVGTPLVAQYSNSAEEATIRAVLSKQGDDWNKGDWEPYFAAYKNSPDILFVGNTVRRGYDQMVTSYKKSFPNKEAMGVLTFTNVEIHMLDAHFATVLGNFHLERTAAGGGNADGIYSLVMEKTKAGWKIILDHTASTPPQKPKVTPVAGAVAAPVAAAAKPCDNPDGHRFDFWIGEWYVTGVDGHHDGDNSVRSLYDGCVIEENWTDVQPYAGKSFNTFEQRTHTWTQYWVDSFGHHTQFTNGVWNEKDQALVFEGHNPAKGGAPAVQRFSFTRVDADNVIQKQEQSLDEGKTWTVTYELHYKRKA